MSSGISLDVRLENGRYVVINGEDEESETPASNWYETECVDLADMY